MDYHTRKVWGSYSSYVKSNENNTPFLSLYVSQLSPDSIEKTRGSIMSGVLTISRSVRHLVT